MLLVFNTGKFLRDHWPTGAKLQTFLVVYGFQVQYAMINQWYQRNRVPAHWGLLLAGLLEVETGRPTSLASYIVLK
jgi:hypothetical protein